MGELILGMTNLGDHLSGDIEDAIECVGREHRVRPGVEIQMWELFIQM